MILAKFINGPPSFITRPIAVTPDSAEKTIQTIKTQSLYVGLSKIKPDFALTERFLELTKQRIVGIMKPNGIIRKRRYFFE